MCNCACIISDRKRGGRGEDVCELSIHLATVSDSFALFAHTERERERETEEERDNKSFSFAAILGCKWRQNIFPYLSRFS